MEKIDFYKTPKEIQKLCNQIVTKDKIKIYKANNLKEIFKIHMKENLSFTIIDKMFDNKIRITSYAIGVILHFNKQGNLTGDGSIYYYELENGNEYNNFKSKLTEYNRTKNEKIFYNF